MEGSPKKQQAKKSAPSDKSQSAQPAFKKQAPLADSAKMPKTDAKQLKTPTKPKDSYEIVTMRHDLDKAKGKDVSSITIDKAQFSQKAQPRNTSSSGNTLAGQPVERRDYTAAAKDEFPEGKIGLQPRQKKEPFQLSSLKKIFALGSNKTLNKKTKIRLAIILTVFLFCGGAGYYLLTSGALSQLNGLKDAVWAIFTQKDTPAKKQPTARHSTSTSPSATSSASDKLPSGSSASSGGATSSPDTATPDTAGGHSPSPTQTSKAFLMADEEEVIKLNTLDEAYSALEKSNSKPVPENGFRRVILMGKDRFSSLRLGQIWQAVKALALGSSSYTELLSTEAIDSWGLAMPDSVYRQLEDNYNLFFYGQPGGGNRVVLIFKVKNPDGLVSTMLNWEPTMLYDLKKIFLGQPHGAPMTNSFVDNIYKDVHIRYLNLPKPNLTIDYALVSQKGYLIITTSRESMWATIDKIFKSLQPSA